MRITFANPSQPKTGVAVILATEGGKLTHSANNLDKQTKANLSRAIKGSRFKGKKGQSLTLMAPHGTKLLSLIHI